MQDLKQKASVHHKSRHNFVEKHQEIVKIYQSKLSMESRWYDKLADFMTNQFGTVAFFTMNLVWFIGWILWNNIPGLPQFDPYPHNFLTMVVSLEAIFLSIIVLISQNRQALMADVRNEIDFNINIRAEEEITKILNLLDAIHDHLGLENEHDSELNEMKKKTNLEEMEKIVAEKYFNKKRR